MRWNLKSSIEEQDGRQNVGERAHFQQSERRKPMNKDRVEGSFEQAKGKAKEVAGKVTGDSKLETEGKAQKTAGKIQNTVGGIKDTIKESVE
jgi:uncharacterized protein YjbJ (UPF0337 family)